MPGPLPLVPENTASSYGQEGQIQKDIQSASQYNPATKLGITSEDQPSKRATPGLTTAQALAPVKTGMGPKANLEKVQPGQAKPYTGPHAFASGHLAEHHSHLSKVPNLSPAMQQYLGQRTQPKQ